MSITSLTPQQLRQAADLQEQIQGLQNELGQILAVEVAASTPAVEPPEPGKTGRKRFSARTRAKMAAAQRARWAALRTGKVTAGEPEQPVKRKRNISAAGRKAMSLAAKRRWAKGAASAPAEKPKTKAQVNEARLKALAKAREARWAKVRAGKKAKA